MLDEVTSRKHSSPLSCIESEGVVISEPRKIAEILNNHFSTIYIGSKLAVKFNSGIKSFLPRTSNDNSTMNKFTLNPFEVQFALKQLSQLKTNKAIGLDRISVRLLKDSAPVIADGLTVLFNRSLDSGNFPLFWKCSKVSALFKSED